MAKTDTTPKSVAGTTANADPHDDVLRSLEESNASLAQRVAELQAELAARDAAVDVERAQVKRDLEGAQYRVREVEATLVAVEAQRDAFQAERDEATARAERILEKNVTLNEEVNDHRAASARYHAEREAAARGHHVSPDDELRRTRRALEISALVSLHVEKVALGLTDERAVSAALRLGDELAAEVEASPAPLG